ncbi:short chain dehydrogenase [Photobacterium sagamiensis]|uniref:short chain dehydrogenase n=1 Tax=Photobacterium sagamiensis TaxID=2910241 RepID=UPI003D0ED0DE
MKILVIGATGVIGKAVVKLLGQDNEIISVGNRSGDFTVDINNKDSIQSLFENVGKVDAIISTTGKGEFGSLENMPDAGYQLVLENKLMGQVNLVRIGLNYLNKGGSITLTSGAAAIHPVPGSIAISMACAAVDAFVVSAALELKDDKRINAVSPSFVKETMEMMGMDSTTGIPAKDVALFYQASINSQSNGKVFQTIEDKHEHG